MEVGHLRLIVFCLMLSASRSSTATKSDTVLCPVSEYIDDQDKTVTEFFECPGADGKKFKINWEIYCQLQMISLLATFIL